MHPLHSLNTLPAKRSEAERVGSVIVNTRILSASSVSSFVYPILRLTLSMVSSILIFTLEFLYLLFYNVNT